MKTLDCMSIITHKKPNVNICNCCGARVSDSEAAEYLEKHGLAEPPFETFHYCPHCAGDLHPAGQCIICGGYEAEDNLLHGICDNCRKVHKSRFNRKLGEAFIKASDLELDFYALSAGLEITVLDGGKVDPFLLAWLKERFEFPLRNRSSIKQIRQGMAELTDRFRNYIFPALEDDYFDWLAGEIEKEGVICLKN